MHLFRPKTSGPTSLCAIAMKDICYSESQIERGSGHPGLEGTELVSLVRETKENKRNMLVIQRQRESREQKEKQEGRVRGIGIPVGPTITAEMQWPRLKGRSAR
jgi:hypothetical protein